MMTLRHHLLAGLVSLALFLPSVAHAQNGSVAPVPLPVFTDSVGAICASCELFTYAAGGTTEQDTWQNVTRTTLHTNPIVLNAAGRPPAPIFLSTASYQFVLQTSAGVEIWSADNILATHAAAAAITSTADITLQVDSDNDGTNVVTIADGTSVVRVQVAETGAVQIDHNLTIGDATAADKTLLLDGNAQDFHVGLDDSADTLVIGRGSVLGTTTAFSVSAADVVTLPAGVTVGDATEADRRVLFDGNAADFHIGIDDSADTLVIGVGSTLGTDTSFRVTTAGVVSIATPSTCEGRITLTSGTAITTADVTAATTVYFTPFRGSQCPLFDGTNWVANTFAELSIAVPATTVTMYDLYYDWADGTPVLATTAWTNDTTRATALTTQNGIYVQTGDTQQRYLGSFRTTGVSGQTEDSLAKRYVWNYYNRTVRPMRVLEATDSWAYTTATWRQANGAATNQVDFVIGVDEAPVSAYAVAHVVSSTPTSAFTACALDATAAPTSGGSITVVISSVRGATRADLTVSPGVGRHYIAWLEYSTAAGTTTWYGDNGDGTLTQSGIWGFVQG